MNTNDINEQTYLLEPLINSALINSIKTVMGRTQVLQEPDYIAALAVNFTGDFYQILRLVFSDYDFAVASVFCHQKPIVDIGFNKKPELGDILFVYIDEDGKGNKKYNSLLFQAKISQSFLHAIGRGEQHQLALYELWPEFKYFKGFLKGTTRNIFPKSISDGAQYLLIDNNPFTNGVFSGAGTFPMGCAIPNQVLQLNRPLSTELIEFLKFKAGRTFDEDKANTKDEWSKMIWDLLEMAAVSYSQRNNIKYKKFARVQVFCSTSTTQQQNINLFDDIVNKSNLINTDCAIPDLLGQGVSIMLIESRRKHKQ